MTDNEDSKGAPAQSGVESESRGILFGRKKKLIVRFFKNGYCVGTKKVKYGVTECSFRKRMYALNYETVYTNQKGQAELNHDFDNGALSMKLNSFRDKFITKADSQIIRELYKRGTVKAIWGVDQIPFLLMVILAGGLVVALIFGFYLFGAMQTQQKTIDSLHQQILDLTTIPPQNIPQMVLPLIER